MLIKKSILTASVAIASLSMSAAAVASYSTNDFFSGNDAGFVVGVQGGYADTHWDNQDPENTLNVKDTGFTARGYVGYDINRYLGLEAGYTYLPKTTFNGGDIKNYTIDLLAKLSVPVTNVFSLYAKAGGSYFNSKGKATDPETGVNLSGTNTHVGPAFGVGAAYEVVPNFAIDLSWMRFSGQGKQDSDYQPNPDVVLLGVSYKFPTRFS